MRHILRILISALIALCLPSCQGRGQVHEAAPPRYPDTPSAHTETPESAPGWEGEDRSSESETYAEPPAATPGWDESRASSAPEARAGASGASPSARDGDWASSSRSRRPAPSKGDHRPHAKRAPEERPGLATHWGETRYSPAHQVDFERADAARPVDIAELHYNDRSGALRMLPGGAWGRSELTAAGGALRLSMVDASGRPFPALRQGERVVSMGDPGERYSLLIENRSPERFEVVATVDGLDVLDGEGGDPDKRGYLIGAYSSVVIDGFRRSDAEVAAFRLGDVARSYAASKGMARNVGVIGFALFDERKPAAFYPVPRYREPWHTDDTYQRRSAEPFPGRYAQPPR